MEMADIIDNEEIDKDTVIPQELENQFSQKLTLITEVNVSQKKSYIKKLCGSRSKKLAAGLSDNGIEVFEFTNSSLRRVCRLSGHQKGLTEVVFCPNEDHMLYSAGLDGLVRLWDTRTSGLCALEYKDPDEQILKPFECMDVSHLGTMLCAGSQLVEDDAYLVFWDQRQPVPLGGYWNSHTDDITQVKFHKQRTETIASGSLDGLLNVYDIMEPTEDDALTYSLNVENSVEHLTWTGESRVACITQSSDLQLWDTDSGDLIKTYTRDKVARSIRRSRDDDCYLVNLFSPKDGTLVLLAGSNAGNGEILRSLTVTEKKLIPCTNFNENKQIVRCSWYDENSGVLVTGGEGGTLSVWGGGAPAGAAPSKPAKHRSKKLAAGLSDNGIEVFEFTNSSLRRVCRLSGHQKGLTEVVFCPNEDHMLYSAGLDGLVRLWDTRTSGLCALEYKDPDEQILKPFECMDVSHLGTMLCAGSQLVEDDAYLVFWDQRQPVPLGGYWNSHTDDITQVKFHKQRTETIASGSLDGLLNVYDIMEPTEDDALTYSLNVENSVEHLTWTGESRVACITQSSDLQLWDTDSGDLIKTYTRDKVARSIRRSRDDDCYLVNLFSPKDGTLVLLAGSNAGNGEILRSLTVTEKKLIPCTNFNENKQIVRCSWYDENSGVLVTGGEGGTLSVWGGGAPAGAAPSKPAKHRYEPYFNKRNLS